jgi:hypothetical protein
LPEDRTLILCLKRRGNKRFPACGSNHDALRQSCGQKQSSLCVRCPILGGFWFPLFRFLWGAAKGVLVFES